MDIDMPIMNGLEATKIIRNLKYFPVMALTGNLRAKEEYLVKMRLDGPEQQEVIAHENTPINGISTCKQVKKYE